MRTHLNAAGFSGCARNRRSQRGATLAELIVTVVVLTILSLVAFAATTAAFNRHWETAHAKVARSLAMAEVESVNGSGRPDPLPADRVETVNNIDYTIAYSESLHDEEGDNRNYYVITVTITWGENGTYTLQTITLP